VSCEVILQHPVYVGWSNGEPIAVNQTAVTVAIDVSLNVTKTSKHTDAQMIQSYYQWAEERMPATVGAGGQILLSHSGIIA
jgi:hypothetical protein